MGGLPTNGEMSSVTHGVAATSASRPVTMQQSFAYRNAKISLRFAARTAWSLPTIPNAFKVSTFTTGRSGSFRKATGSSSPRLSIKQGSRIGNSGESRRSILPATFAFGWNPERPRIELREHPHLDYGYAMTSYAGQGQTVDRVIVHVPAKDMASPELVNHRIGYMAVTRGHG